MGSQVRQAYTLTPVGVRWDERIRKRGSLLPFLREIGLVCSISSEGQRIRTVKARRRTKAFMPDVGGKEVSVACSFLWLPQTLFPEEYRDWQDHCACNRTKSTRP